jgi:hypothetical protein
MRLAEARDHVLCRLATNQIRLESMFYFVGNFIVQY